MKKSLFVLLGCCFVWGFPIFFFYCQNAKEMPVNEALFPILISILIGILFLILGRILFKNIYTAGFFSTYNGIVLLNFNLLLKALQKMSSIIRYWYLLPIIILIGIVIVYFINKYSNDETKKNFSLVITIVFGALCLVNLVTAIPNIHIDAAESASLAESNQEIPGKNNIYYLLCDEYASQKQLIEDFNYDNQTFYDQLESLSFNISQTSKNDSDSTNVVMANCMAMDYIADSEMSADELSRITKDGQWQKLLTQQGYTIQGIGDTEWLGISGSIEESGAKTAEGANFTEMFIQKTFLAPFIHQNYDADAQVIKDALTSLETMDIQEKSSIFTMFYICAPHHPYYFDEHGDPNSPNNYFNQDGKHGKYYVDELKWISSRVLSGIEHIVENDPDATIVLCSDHGNRFGNVSSMDNVYTILNALYLGGESVPEINGKSGVNTLRLIANKMFSMDLPYIDLPY